MREIGVRQLRATLSETLRSVGRGEHVRVTLRGRPIADILPAGAAVADDRLVPPRRARPKRAPRLAQAARRASALVLAERDAEG